MSALACRKSLTPAAPIPCEPTVISSAFPASEIIQPPAFGESIFRSVCSENPFHSRERRFKPHLTRACGHFARSGHQVCKQFRRKLIEALCRAVLEHAFGIPLHPNHPIPPFGPFDGLYDSVRCVRRHTQTLCWPFDGLMVRAIDLRACAPGKPLNQTP